LPTITPVEKREQGPFRIETGVFIEPDRLVRQIGPPFSDGSDDDQRRNTVTLTVNGGLIDSNDYPSLVKPQRRVDGV
jgi:hypothetical protein